jgi:hypothetical protein
MRVQVDFAALKDTKWYQAALRFCCGGLATAATGIIAKKYGPSVGGIFLAFPAILPASATLIEKHERQRKERIGLHGSVRARSRCRWSGHGKRRALRFCAAGREIHIALPAGVRDRGISGRVDGYFSAYLATSQAHVGWLIVRDVLAQT